MDAALNAAEVLRQAEASLRDLVSKAASRGDYPSVVQIASWAQAVGEMLKAAPITKPSAATDKALRPIPVAPKPPAKKKSGGRADEYPKFFRQGDQLLRIAWSKKEKKEYQHKAPRIVLQALVTAIAAAGKNGQVFSTDNILPISDGEGTEIPNYQAYVGISLLKQLELIHPHGRQGYSATAPNELVKAVDSIWSQLPSK